MNIIHEKSCGIIVFHEGAHGKREYLLLHYPGGHWDLPKGHVEKGETEHETALRELKEETGITGVKILPDFRERIHYNYRRHHGYRQAGKIETCSKDVIFFVARVLKKAITLSHEHKNFDWQPYVAALKKLTFQNARGLVEKAEKFLSV